MKVLLTSIVTLFMTSALTGQMDMFHVEKGGKEFKLVMPDEFIYPEFPTGIIYQGTSGLGFANLSERQLRIASKPYPLQLQPENLLFTELTDHAFSINRHIGSEEELIWIGPNQMARWGPRNPASPFSSYYDLETYGNIWTKNDFDRKMSELTQCGGKGALKLYWYDGGGQQGCHTLGIDDDGNIKWLVSSGISILDDIFLVEEPILPFIPKLQLKRFHYKGFEKAAQGYIAEEVKEVFPELVSETEDGILAINYAGFTPIALQAIKEQQEIIETLIERIEVLEDSIQK